MQLPGASGLTFGNNIQHAIVLPADLAYLGCTAHRVQVHRSRVTPCHADLTIVNTSMYNI